MMESGRTVLFARGAENSDEDIWDDSALITAYDKAVGTAKKIIKEKREAAAAAASGGSASESSSNVDRLQTSLPKRQNRNRKWSHNKNKKQSSFQKLSKWSEGDRCSAVYSVDGVAYDAEILSIDKESGTCIVSFVEYGNEEEVYLDDLLQPTETKSSGKSAKKSQNLSNQQKLHGDGAGCYKDYNYKKSSHEGNSAASQWQTVNHQQAPSSYHQPQPPSFNSPWAPNPIHIPPLGMPPPMPVFEDGVVGDEDAMASMLMAWYMCGYHSGYYQGLKQTKRQADNCYP